KVSREAGAIQSNISNGSKVSREAGAIQSASNSSRSTSRILRIAILLTDIGSSLAKGRTYQRLLNQCVNDDSGECEQ
ncbi:hypothetical protein, partial [Aeromonas hydrophila]|uniref:hypothetical protein n=1 Tax=Aeromonas hydrophila TaxID=644 RepID=UPI0039F5625E